MQAADSPDVSTSRVSWLRSAWCVRVIVGGLLVVHAGLLAWGAYRHSPTLNEPGHLVAGISHWQFGRFELYRVNPPLVRMVAALPVLAAGCETDWSSFYESPGARPVFAIGSDFIAANGERSLWLFTIVRWACIPFSLIGGVVCFLWARELYSTAGGLLALTLWCFEPNIIAHGQLITCDAAATSFGLLAGYLFWRWLKRPTWNRAATAGFALGLAQLAKMSWLFLFALWPVLWLIWRLTQPRVRHPQPSTVNPQPFIHLATILLLGLYVLNLGYGFDGTFTKLRDFTFVSGTLSGLEKAGTPGNRFAKTWLGHVPVPLPKQYLLGLDVQKREFETPAASYLRGEWKDGGWWYYYLYGLAVKLPHGTQLLILLALAISIAEWFGLRTTDNRQRITDPSDSQPSTLNAQASSGPQPSTLDHQPSRRHDLVLLAPAIVLFVLVSSQTAFNHRVRYVLPVLGPAFVLVGRVAQAVSRSLRAPGNIL